MTDAAPCPSVFLAEACFSESTEQVSTGVGLEAKVRRRRHVVTWNVDVAGNRGFKVQVEPRLWASNCGARDFSRVPGALAAPLSSVGPQHPLGFRQKRGNRRAPPISLLVREWGHGLSLQEVMEKAGQVLEGAGAEASDGL